MLRTESLPKLVEAATALSPGVLVAGLGLAVAACSADISRFDSPMFGLTESGNRVSSAPIPRENVLTARAAAPADYASNSGAYAPPRNQVAMAPAGNFGSYAPPSASRQGGYQGTPYQPAYTPPPYPTPQQQPSYQAPYGPPQTYQPPPSYRQAYDGPPPNQTMHQPTSYRPPAQPEPQSHLAALPPPGGAASYRPQPARPAQVAAAPQRPASGAREIEVQPGDTLYGLAQRHRVSISEVMRLNGLHSPVIRPGQRIMLPEQPTSMAAAVRRPATAEAASAKLARAEDAAPADASPAPETQTALAAAQESPAEPSATAAHPAEAAAEDADSYTIKHGESLYGIAVRHRVALAELQRINNITDPRKVKAGTVLRLPSASTAAATAVAAAPAPLSQPAPLETAAVPRMNGAGPAVRPVIINAPEQRTAAPGSSETAGDGASQLPAADAEKTDVAAASGPGEAMSAASASATEPASASTAKFRWPVKGKVIAGFGRQPDGQYSDGIKLAVPLGTEVHAAESGVVAYAGSELKGYGNLVLLRHDNGWISAYAHNEELSVKRGDRVRRGQVIAKAGNTGNAVKPQLHFELRQGSSPVDPIPHLEKL